MNKLPVALGIGLLLAGCGSDDVEKNPKHSEALTEKAEARETIQELISEEPEDMVVAFKDFILESAVQKELGASEEGITRKDFKSLKELVAVDHGITDLSGLELCTQLTILNLSNNRITEIKPLAKLTQLNSLNLGSNRIADLASLADLGKLSHLDLHSNQITDVAPLKELNNLTLLDLSNNKIPDAGKEMLRKALSDCDIFF